MEMFQNNKLKPKKDFKLVRKYNWQRHLSPIYDDHKSVVHNC